MNKQKAQVVTGLIFLLLIILAADIVAIFPKALPWLLAVLAIPGALWFCKVLFTWLTDDNAPLPKISAPAHKKKKNGVDWTRVWAGLPKDGGE